MKGNPNAFDAILDRLHPDVRRAFKGAIERITSTAKLRDVEKLLDRGDVEGLLNALNLSPDYFREVQDAIEQAFYLGGQYQAGLTASLSSIPFNRRHWSAEAWARDNGSRLIVEIAESTREGVRQFVIEGLQKGQGTGAIARGIIGRVNRATGKREGGIVGLTGQQASYVADMRAALSTDGGLAVGVSRLDENGEPVKKFWIKRDGTLGSVFEARDRRHDRLIRRAIENGKPLSKAEVDRIVQKYSEGLLIRRGDMIARTETLGALNAGRFEAMQQQIERLGLTRDDVVATWVSARDLRVRDSHRSLNGDQVEFGQPFQSDSGAMLRFPGDRMLGAPASEVIACRCNVTFEVRRQA